MIGKDTVKIEFYTHKKTKEKLKKISKGNISKYVNNLVSKDLGNDISEKEDEQDLYYKGATDTVSAMFNLIEFNGVKKTLQIFASSIPDNQYAKKYLK